VEGQQCRLADWPSWRRRLAALPQSLEECRIRSSRSGRPARLVVCAATAEDLV
jgi:hypothetical protein